MADKSEQERLLEQAQIALIGAYQSVAVKERKVIILLEGRDAAGKDGAIRRIVEHLPARQVRPVSLPAPSERERRSWYFQRYVAHLPANGEIVLFNRSWYNRAGVEPVMGFCTPAEHAAFLQTAPEFESLLVDSGFELIKYYLDISKAEQQQRLEARRTDPLKQWKIGPLDARALELFDAYTEARDQMLTRTHTARTPWIVVQADKKPRTRLQLIRDMVARLAPEFSKQAGAVDPAVMREFSTEMLTNGFLSR